MLTALAGGTRRGENCAVDTPFLPAAGRSRSMRGSTSRIIAKVATNSSIVTRSGAFKEYAGFLSSCLNQPEVQGAKRLLVLG